MEEFLWTIVFLFVLPAVLGGLRSLGGDSQTRQRPYRSENQLPAAAMPDVLEFRFVNTRLGENNDGPQAKEIKGRGLIPVRKPTRVGFMTSVFDATTGELEPVLSAIEAFQEPESVVYQGRVEVGTVLPDQGFRDWVRLGVVIPEILEPPYGGKRKITAIVRMIDLDNVPPVMHGFHEPDHPGLLFQSSLNFNWTFQEKGYREVAANREEATAIAIKVAIAVAMADGSLEQREGLILKQWIGRRVHHLTGERKEHLKKIYNDAMRAAYVAAKDGRLDLTTLTGRLNEIGETSLKYEAVELCFDVMAGDGVASPDEMRTIHDVAAALELSLPEMERLRDQKLLALDTSISGHASVEEMLGILPDWDNEHIKRHLRVEFNKWNNRLNHLSEGQERANAQRMLDVISQARQKYV